MVTTLQNALSSDSLGHAYLFSGLRGVGKTTAARLLAKRGGRARIDMNPRGTGFSLHESVRTPNYGTVREAIEAAMEASQ